MSLPRPNEDTDTYRYFRHHHEFPVENRREVARIFRDSRRESSQPASGVFQYGSPLRYNHYQEQPNDYHYFSLPGPPTPGPQRPPLSGSIVPPEAPPPPQTPPPPPLTRLSIRAATERSSIPPEINSSRFNNQPDHHSKMPSVTPPRQSGRDRSLEAGDNDVLCGRGAPTTWHPGNRFFRKLVKGYQNAYLDSGRSEKALIATRIIDEIKSRGGRFLKRYKRSVMWEREHFVWVEIGEQRVYEKACQALREGAPEIRRQLLLKAGRKKKDESSDK